MNLVAPEVDVIPETVNWVVVVLPEAFTLKVVPPVKFLPS